MKSFIHNSLISNPASRNKRLALTLLISFCLTYMGQAFALPMICIIPASAVADFRELEGTIPLVNAAESKHSSPCHQIMAENSAMDCCDHTSSEDARLNMSSHDCSCSDGGCGASITFLSSFSCGSLTINEQPDYYSTIGFPNQIDSALFRPPIA